ncbi:MAG: SGNH/GDSL hydrolase family protein [Planctomycetaceae bacterium]
MRLLPMWSLIVFGIAASMGQADSSTPAKRPAARKPNPAMAKIEDIAGLPRVLLIGDSISIGYTLDVRAGLAGKANVHRIPTNGGPTTNGLKNIDAWLRDSKWDVIHFNWGLHDLKYMNEQGQLVGNVSEGKQQVSLDDYEQNLEQLVTRLQKTGAKLIFATTTPVPEGSAGRVPGDAVKYNDAALRVMRKHGVAIDDLYAFAKPQLKEIQLPANVHFSPAGSKMLSEAVVKSITEALAQK